MKDLDQKLKQFVFDYRIENHNQEKSNAQLLFKKFPKDINLFNTIGVLFLQNKKYEDAIIALKQVIKLNPEDVNTHHNLGVAWTQLNKIDEAISCYLKSETLNSKNSLTFYNLGVLYTKNNKYKDSIKYYNKAIKLNNNIAKYYYNLAWTYAELKHHNDAKENFKKAIKLNPKEEKYYYNLAWVETELKEFDNAINHYNKAIIINNDHFEAKFKKSLICLINENFTEGWENYESRSKIDEAEFNQKIILNLNQWNGEKFDGTLYVHGEQGVGDQILHSSMIQDLYKRHSDICLIVDERLLSLFKRSFEKIKIAAFNSNLKFKTNDYHILFGSLGKFFRKSIKDFKKPQPYIFPNKAKIKKYKEYFSQNKNNKIIVGLSWWSKSNINQDRIISLEQLSKIIMLENFEFVDLQYGDTFVERKLFKEKYGKEIIHFDNLDLMNDFEGLAALIFNCDFILTIDNFIAHLSGSTGKDTLIFLSKYSFWYWFHNRSNSLWYPSIKLFRQVEKQSWEEVIEKVMRECLKEITL